eukprot:4456849-Amphidinium_carterae.2
MARDHPKRLRCCSAECMCEMMMMHEACAVLPQHSATSLVPYPPLRFAIRRWVVVLLNACYSSFSVQPDRMLHVTTTSATYSVGTSSSELKRRMVVLMPGLLTKHEVDILLGYPAVWQLNSRSTPSSASKSKVGKLQKL